MNFELTVIGSGLSGLSFVDSFVEKHPNKKINIISPNFYGKIKNYNYEESFLSTRDIPPQMHDKKNKIKSFFFFNNIEIQNNLNILGSLEHGGLSNYWGTQLEADFSDTKKILTKKNQYNLVRNFYELAKKVKFIGSFKEENYLYKNDYFIDKLFLELSKYSDENLCFKKPLLAVLNKIKKNQSLNFINRNSIKLNSINYYRKFIKKKNIKFHNYAVQEVLKVGKKIKLLCTNGKKVKIIYTNKIIFATGTIVTTKLLMKMLKIKKEVRIKEHPRLITLFFSRKKLANQLDFMPSQLQAYSSKYKELFLADFRPGNSFILRTAVQVYKLLKPFYFILDYFKDFMIFSNFLVSSKYSNIYIKIKKNKSIIFAKKNISNKILSSAHKKVFLFLKKKKIIFPFFKNFRTNEGSSYHYFGSIKIGKKNKNKLSVDQNCRLNGHKNIFIVDGSVIDFKKNKYPLGIVMANARRIAKIV